MTISTDMSFERDDRGQMIQIGAVLVFGLLVVVFASYQATVVPGQNEAVEFDHNLRVQGQLEDLRNAITAVSDDDSTRSVSVALGAEYTDRVIARNPASPTGTLRTVGTTDPLVNASVANATAEGDPGDVWNGTERVFTTGVLVYEPNYNEYDDAPTTVYENTVLFTELDEDNRTRTGQQIVSGNVLNLVTLNGTLETTRAGSTTIDVMPTSVSTRTVAVTNDSSGNVTLRLATRLDGESWRDLLDGEFTDQGGHVVGVRTETRPDTPFDSLTIELEGNETYRLQVTRVGVGTGIERPERSYVTPVAGNGSSVPEGETVELVVEVRDRLDNPVEGALVNATTRRASSSLRTRSDITGEDGQVTLVYEAPADVEKGTVTDEVNVSYAVDPASATGFDPGAPENTTLSVTVRDIEGGGGGEGEGGTDTDRAYTARWFDPSGADGVSCPLGTGGVCEIDASETVMFPLTVDTNPSVVGNTVEYATNGSTTLALGANSGTTNDSGQDTVDLKVGKVTDQDAGVVSASTGSDNDAITFDVITPGDCAFLNENFEFGELPDGWSEVSVSGFDGGVDDRTNNTGSYSAYTGEGEGYVSTTSINTSDCNTVEVDHWLRKGAGSFSDPPEGSENDDLRLEYRNSAGSWVEIAYFDAGDYGEGEVIDVEETITDSDAMHTDFKLRWYQIKGAGSGWDYWHFDDVNVTAR